MLGVAIGAENVCPTLSRLPDTSKRPIESTTVTSVECLDGVAAQATGRLTISKYSKSRAVQAFMRFETSYLPVRNLGNHEGACSCISSDSGLLIVELKHAK